MAAEGLFSWNLTRLGGVDTVPDCFRMGGNRFELVESLIGNLNNCFGLKETVGYK